MVVVSTIRTVTDVPSELFFVSMIMPVFFLQEHAICLSNVEDVL